MNLEEIGNYIRNGRRRKKLSLRELADLTGISYSTINKYENGVIVPKQDKFEKIQSVLGVAQDSPTKESESERELIEILLKPAEKSTFNRYLVMDIVRRRANGFCELCGEAAPFKVHGVPFLEFHRVRPLSDGGDLTSTNLVALCPNCHARVTNAPTDEIQAKLEVVVCK